MKLDVNKINASQNINGIDLNFPFLMLFLVYLKIVGPALFADIYVFIMAKIESWAWSKERRLA